MDIRQALASQLIVHGLTPDQITTVASLAKPARFMRGELLARLGARDADLFVILEGEVNVLTADGDQLGEIKAGGVLGEVAFVDGGPRVANYVAQGFVVALQFPARELRALMNQDRNIGFVMLANLSRLLAARLRVASDRLDLLMDLEQDVWTGGI